MNLPLTTSGRSPAWVGMVLLAVIELMVMASLVAAYFYLRVGTPLWPPVAAGMPDLVLSGTGQVLVVGSGLLAFLAEGAWRRGNRRPLRWLFPLGALLVTAYLGLKAAEYATVTYHWSSHAYGSINWTMTVYQGLHGLVLLGLAGMVWLFDAQGWLGAQRATAVECAALYWYFVVLSSLLEFATTHLSPYLLL